MNPRTDSFRSARVALVAPGPGVPRRRGRALKRPGNAVRAKPRPVREEQLFKCLDRRARRAVWTLLESMADLDPARAARFIEAMAMLFATCTAPGKHR